MYFALIGYALVVALMTLLFKARSAPISLFAVLPVIAGFALGYTPQQMSGFITEGVMQTAPNAVLFTFSIMFFNIISEKGVFQPLVNGLLKVAGDSVVGIVVVTGFIALVAHMDGSSVPTVLITIGAMLPIYRQLKLRPTVLLCMLAAGMGVTNITPWAGPLARVAAVSNLDVNALYHQLLPVQGLSVVLMVLMGIYLGMREQARLKRGQPIPEVSEEVAAPASGSHGHGTGDVWKDDRLSFLINLSLLVGVTVLLLVTHVQAYVLFMVAFGLAMLINHPSLKAQEQVMKKYAYSAYMIAGTVMAAGAFVGIVSGGGDHSILTQMANVVLNVVPDSVGPHLHIITGLLSGLIGFVMGPDAFFYGIYPLMAKTGEHYGISWQEMGLSMVVGKNVAMMISPVFATTYLALGLTGTTLSDHVRFSFAPIMLMSVVMVLALIVFGTVPA